MMSEIRGAVDGKDTDRLRRAAHGLKGSVGALGGKAAYEAAAALETVPTADWAAVEGVNRELEEQVRKLELEFKTWLGEVRLAS